MLKNELLGGVMQKVVADSDEQQLAITEEILKMIKETATLDYRLLLVGDPSQGSGEDLFMELLGFLADAYESSFVSSV
jgi:hypothetical protein